MLLSDLVFRQRPLAQLEDQRRLSSAHFGFETAFVECFAERIDGVRVAPAAEGDEARSALEIVSKTNGMRGKLSRQTYEESCGGDANADGDC